MKELLTCCYVLMEIELRAQQTDRLFTLLHMAEMIDLLCRGGIIETRYSDDQPRDDHGRWMGGGGGESSGGTSDSDTLTDQLNDSSVDYHPVTDAAIDSIPEIAVFDNAELNQAVHTGCVDVLKAVKDAPPGTEATISISLDMKQKSDVQIGEPGAGTVHPVKMNVPYLSIHNHASGETFSGRDIQKFVADEKVSALCVVGNNGKVFILEKTDSFNWVQFGIKTHSFSESSDYNLQVLNGAEQYGLRYYEK